MASDNVARKPLAPAESLVGKTLHLAPTIWNRLATEGRRRGFDEPLVFTRKLVEHALEDAERASRMEASVGMPARNPDSSRRTRRF